MQGRGSRKGWRSCVHGTAALLAVGMTLRVFLLGFAVYGTPAYTCGCSDGVCCCHPTSSVPRLEPCRWKGFPEAGFALLTPWAGPSPWVGTPEAPTAFLGRIGILRPSFESPPELPDPPPRTLA